ncbi:hypothetical protein [Klebsiella pneumoniae]|uniref:hypothetical protein n=1 Tax=Klebsiella pneumoniae TaxID=573 RepID=UPI001559D831|nr:hypothetical protein [Klebsiella pneumoniae]BCI98455.1 hypothetical protein VNKP15269_C54490 [Klebsiella pneumoniae]
MSEDIVAKDLKLVVNRLMRNFIKKVGAKDEPLIWGFKANASIQKDAAAVLSECIDRIKVRSVKILNDQVHMDGGKYPQLKGLEKGSVVFITNADTWDQDVLLRVAIQSSQSGSKVLLGFSDPSRLSIGIYQFLVAQQISKNYELSHWAINMSIPIREIR